MNKNPEEMTIEEAFQALETLLQDMENKDSSLEDTFAKYREGLGLVKLLNGRIDGIEKQLEILSAGEEQA